MILDKNKDNPEASKAKFVEIANAYEVLSDPEKKRTYDMYGEEGVDKEAAMRSQGQSNQHTYYRTQQNNFNFDDMFENMFKGSGFGGFNFTIIKKLIS